MIRAALISAAALTVAACSTPQTPAPVQQTAAPIETPPQEVPAPIEEPAGPSVDFSLINGKTPASVQDYLGQPSLVRRDENVQIMIFETDTCVFQVTFYEPSNGDHFRAEHTDARNRKGNAYDPELCVQQLLTTQE